MSTIVITGANRGVGLALTRAYAEAGDQVHALCRDPDGAAALHELGRATGRVTVGRIDIADKASIDAAAAAVSGPVDILINNAGILAGEDQSLDGVDLDVWMEAFRVMAIGPFLVSRAFLPQLEQAGGRIAFLSSQLAASTWPYGGHYAYSSAKAAGNRVAQILAIDLKDKGISTVVLHPGYVQTDMGGPTADITAEESAAGIVQVIANVTPQTSGRFMKWTGEPHPL
ncbi:SDR family oxidoreductase [Sphingomonas jatrophae]|uniref:NADP-dependent 3-hydroxy acid dehydrogenase YdfG n=1 Tax=Sphingomonas jatrophae TaxID=1166337 RepID=A0A1I6M1M4_9SPHN|nr:SDR family oxidoreductase [Sphingomonas jatrophae]SFS09534.1 NADP-dependent 3-hydroxy acid dehydrogenase YdfG [Sphingomonas jatrophae]